MAIKMKMCRHRCSKCGTVGKCLQVPGTAKMPKGWVTGYLSLTMFTSGKDLHISLGELCKDCRIQLVDTMSYYKETGMERL